ncbi:MAG: hypothetical protein H7832_07675 [Magnetococcus sp. DMHC-6]
MNTQTTHTIPKGALYFEAPVLLTVKDDVRRFEGVAYSGNEITGHWYWGKVIFDLETTTSNNRLPMLIGHDRARIAGFSETVEIGEGVRIQGRLSSRTEAGQQVADLADEGFPWQMSVHIEPGRIDQITKEDTVIVNNHPFTGPGVVFRNSVLREVSFTPTGFDPLTSAHVMGRDFFETQFSFLQHKGDGMTKNESEQTQSIAQAVQPAEPDYRRLFEQEQKRASDLDAQLTQERQERRIEMVQQLFAQLGKEWSVEAAKPYLEMDPGHFSAVAADLRTIKPIHPEILFQEQALMGVDASKTGPDASLIESMSKLPY